MSDPVEAPRRILARGKTVTGHVGACVRYDRPVLLTDTMLNDAALRDLLTKNVCLSPPDKGRGRPTGRVVTQLMLLQHSNDLLLPNLTRFMSQTPVQPGLVRRGNVTTTK